ncbi:hypothetical protein ASD11_15130 [Aeromicrobium sp. Root495]|nr:hypothetical protein ASD11_15130 [Aeromicrobium sp. Root495]
MPPTSRPLDLQARSSWFATAAHKVKAEDRDPALGSLVPWGTVHWKRLGSALTGCGIPCLTWPVFFDVDVRERSLDICPECRRLTTSDQTPQEC